MSEERIRETYKQVATEQTPEHLDKTVLREAARAARPRYSKLIAWTRPMAWAATVMLSVALVLEVTRTPVPESASHDAAPVPMAPAELPALEKAADASADASLDEVVVAQPQADYHPPAANAGRTDDAAEELKAAPLRSSAKQVVEPELQDEKRERDDERLRLQVDAPVAEAEFEGDAFAVGDTDMLQRAEEMGRLREGSIAAEQALPESFAVMSTSATTPCEAKETERPETWLECIERLEELGLQAEADQQRELLAAAFPDFKAD